MIEISSEELTEVVYAIFESKISLDDPMLTLKEIKNFVKKYRIDNEE